MLERPVIVMFCYISFSNFKHRTNTKRFLYAMKVACFRLSSSICVYVFEKYRDVLIFQLANVLQAVQRVPGKSADGFGNDHVYVTCHALINRAIKFFVLFGIGT